MQKLIVILGPTASGKSDIAVQLALRLCSEQAKKFSTKGGSIHGWNGAEIISADSRQVYKGLNIGTGKITKKEMCDIPHYLLDICSPQKRFTAADFKKQAERAIKKIASEKKLPIICGGTGFYIDALLGNKQIPEVPPNEKLRKELESKTIGELFNILEKLDPERAKNIDAKNPRRLIRAIEICKTLGLVPKLVASSQNLEVGKYEVLKIGIAPIKKITHPQTPSQREGVKRDKYSLSESNLKNKINKRIDKWFKQGLLKEVQNLHKKGLSWKRMSEIGLEYKIVAQYLQSHSAKATRGKGEISKSSFAKATADKSEMIEKMQKETWKYAKRQMTYFKKIPNVIWLPPKISLIEKEVKKFL